MEGDLGSERRRPARPDRSSGSGHPSLGLTDLLLIVGAVLVTAAAVLVAVLIA